MRRLDVINLAAERERPAPVMPSACESGGCGGTEAPRSSLPDPASFGEVCVNGIEIPPEAIAQEIQHHPSSSPEEAWKEAARALAVRELLLQEARRLELEADPDEDEAGRSETPEDALVRTLLEETVEPESPKEEEVRRYYETHAERFRTATIYEASHILIEPEGDEEAWNRAFQQARSIASEVGNDPAAFAAAARSFSTCPSAQQDGSLGQVRRGELVQEVQAALDRLAEGTTATEPIRSRFGWHVIRLQRKIEGRQLPYDMVKSRIADMLEARSWSMGALRYVAALAERGDVQGVRIGEPA